MLHAVYDFSKNSYTRKRLLFALLLLKCTRFLFVGSKVNNASCFGFLPKTLQNYYIFFKEQNFRSINSRFRCKSTQIIQFEQQSAPKKQSGALSCIKPKDFDTKIVRGLAQTPFFVYLCAKFL